MRVLIHSLVFSPDAVSTAYLYSDIALKLKQSGIDVKVLTTTPHYNVLKENLNKQPLRWKFPGICKTSNYHGIDVYHIPQYKFRNIFLRCLGFIYWHIFSFLVGLFIRNIDVILSPSPPLTIGAINLILAKIKKCKVIYNVQEIYPDIMGLSDGLILRVLRKLESSVYNNSDVVTTIDEIFYNKIVDRFEDKSKLKIVPNFVDSDLYSPNVDINILGEEFIRNDNLKLLYAGNIGVAQDWLLLVDIAKKLVNEKIDFYVIGEGAKRLELIELIDRNKLKNIHLLPYQRRELMPAIISFSDLQFIFMEKNNDIGGFPSKVYTIMSCGKPMLVSSSERTPIVNFLKDTGCAKICNHEIINDRAKEIISWLEGIKRSELQEMGKKGRQVIEKEYTKDIVTGQYLKIIQNL